MPKAPSKSELKDITPQHPTGWSDWLQMTESTSHGTYECPSVPVLVNYRFPRADQEVANVGKYKAKDFIRLPRTDEQLSKAQAME